MPQASDKRPVIGITTDYNQRDTQYALPYGYAKSVELAGGLPLLIPFKTELALIPQYVDLLDGILFSGGDDLDPTAWGEQPHPKIEPINPDRETFERALLTEVEKRRLPTLCVCLGSQLLNVHRGGTLHQFLPDEPTNDPIEHRRQQDWGRRHSVHLVEGTRVAQALGPGDIEVNTSHKQSIHKLGKGLRIIATAPDGVIEGVEDPEMPLFVGVQWHPERLSEKPEHLALFKMLVDKAAE